MIALCHTPAERALLPDRLRDAIRAHDAQQIDLLCDAGIASTKGLGTPFLVLAMQTGCSASIVKALLDGGADPNEREDIAGWLLSDETPAPLHLVTDQHDPAIVGLLLDASADLRSTWKGFTTQFRAAYRGDVGVVAQLVARGGDPAGLDVEDAHGNTPLALHASSTDPTVALRLLDHGASAKKARDSAKWRKTLHMCGETRTMVAVEDWVAQQKRKARIRDTSPRGERLDPEAVAKAFNAKSVA